jgi:hypothetical protein
MDGLWVVWDHARLLDGPRAVFRSADEARAWGEGLGEGRAWVRRQTLRELVSDLNHPAHRDHGGATAPPGRPYVPGWGAPGGPSIKTVPSDDELAEVGS